MRVFLAAVAALALTLPALAERQIIGSEEDHSSAAATDCDSFFKTTFTSFPARAAQREQRDISMSGLERLRVLPSEDGGVAIRGWKRPYARLIICRNAVATTKPHAARLLEALHVTHAKGEIAAQGPPVDATAAWWVDMIVYVPHRATVDVRTVKGGVAIRNMNGNVTAHTGSGGISVAQSAGRYRVATGSGGITLERVSGMVEASSRDGGIALKLPTLDGRTVEARIASGGEILCTARGCEGAEWGTNRRQLRLGHGEPEIRLSTAAGPILIGPVSF